MAKITKEMVEHLNKELKDHGVGFYYTYHGEDTISPNIHIHVVDAGMGWIRSDEVYCTKNYFEWLENWFMKNYGITLSYNNTGKIIWSNDFI